MVGRFNALTQRNNVDFEAWFNEEREPDRSWDVNEQDWRFRARYIPQRRVLGKQLHLPLAELRATRPDLLICLPHSADFAVGMLVGRALSRRVGFRILPVFESWVQRTWWRDLIYHFLHRAVDGAEVPGPAAIALASGYGLDKDRCIRVTQSIDVVHYAQARKIDQQDRNARREELGLQGCVFLYVGRLWEGKGLDYLFEAYRRLTTTTQNVSLLIIGDGSQEQLYRQATTDLPRVVFTGFVQPTDIPAYFGLADVFVFPTLGDPHGLVVEEAMSAGLPVISTTAAGDIEHRVPHGCAGYLVPPRDPTSLMQRMSDLAADRVLRARFAETAWRLVEEQHHDRWASDFEKLAQHILESPERSTIAAQSARLAGHVLNRFRKASNIDDPGEA